ncbi:EXS family protein [Xylogone sp. PMI_703]|nr:EXS family protein [Xylogone sp. PMI_703]
MDKDPAVEAELDSFSLTFPLPYRVALLTVLGVWAWGANLHYLSLVKIDVPSLIRYPPRQSHNQPPHHLTTYRFATLLTIPLVFSYIFFLLVTRRDAGLVIYYDYLPITLLLLLFLMLLFPIRLPLPIRSQLSQTGRLRFLQVLRRISTGYIAQASDGKFGDILLADVLTSYAKPLADLFVSFCMFFSPAPVSATARPDRNCGGQILVPLIIALPSAIRFRQCVIEYLRVRNGNIRSGSIGTAGWGGQHLANALKYSSAFPVIIFSALQRSKDAEASISTANYYRHVWLLAVAVNSLYSFYWDVAKDWDLTLFSTARERNDPHHPYGLRSRLYFYPTSIYYLVIATDLLLRCTWSLKLSPHLANFADYESGIFLMELAEVGRRWIWIFFRVETEWVRNTTTAGLGGPGGDDILLGEYNGKDEDD